MNPLTKEQFKYVLEHLQIGCYLTFNPNETTDTATVSRKDISGNWRVTWSNPYRTNDWDISTHGIIYYSYFSDPRFPDGTSMLLPVPIHRKVINKIKQLDEKFAARQKEKKECQLSLNTSHAPPVEARTIAGSGVTDMSGASDVVQAAQEPFTQGLRDMTVRENRLMSRVIFRTTQTLDLIRGQVNISTSF